MKTKMSLAVFCLSFLLGSTAYAQWSGTSPLTTNSNVIIGTDNTSSTSVTPTVKLSIREDNPYLELADVNPTMQTPGPPYGLATTGIRLTAGATTYEFKNWQAPASPAQIFSLTKTGSNFGYHLLGTNLWLGGCGILASPQNGEVKVGSNMEVLGTTQFYGQVGINTSCVPAGYFLAVNGKVICTEVKVMLKPNSDCTGWGDFVFKPDYKLMPLGEVHNYVNENSHLPGIPAANEIETEGLEVGEMQRLQMIKIEELYLYMFELKNQNEQLQQRNAELERRIQVLEQK